MKTRYILYFPSDGFIFFEKKDIMEKVAENEIKIVVFFWQTIIECIPLQRNCVKLSSAACMDFKTIYDTYYKSAYRYAISYVHDKMVAEDLVSEAFVYLWQLGREKEVESPVGVLMTFIKNRALNYLRHEQEVEQARKVLSERGKRELQLRITTLEGCNPQEILSAEFQNRLKALLNEMSPNMRTAFVMCKIEGRPYKEVAQELGMTVKGVEYHISKALAFLRQHMREYSPFLLLWYM